MAFKDIRGKRKMVDKIKDMKIHEKGTAKINVIKGNRMIIKGNTVESI